MVQISGKNSVASQEVRREVVPEWLIRQHSVTKESFSPYSHIVTPVNEFEAVFSFVD